MTDTNSGISVSEGSENGIFVLPLPILIDEKDYTEGIDIDHQQIFAAMKEGRTVSTSQPSTGALYRFWDDLLNHYDEIVYIPMTSGLSSSCDTAKSVAYDFNGRVAVVDNHRISMTLLDAVYDAKYLADEGMSAAMIQRRLETDNRSLIYIMVNELKYIVKSGRITPAGAAVATVVGIRPILKIEDGKLDAFDKGRGVKKCEEIMLRAAKDELLRNYAGIEKSHIHIGVAGTMTDEAEVTAWIDKIRENFPGYHVAYRPLSCSIACHIGSGTKGISVGTVFRP